MASSILRRASGPLLEGDESGAVGGSNTRPTVLHLGTRIQSTLKQLRANEDQKPNKRELQGKETHGLVGDGELAQVVSNHLRLDLNLEEKSDDIQ